MKTTTKRYLSLLLFLFSIHNFPAAQQQDNYHYKYYNTSHGLPSTEIISLEKDSKGFLWIGTSAGVSMYDGYNFHNYPYSKNKEFIGYVNVIRQDDHDRLWIGSGAGLFCFINDELIKISASTSLPQGVNDILIEEDGTMWLATENGPVRSTISQVDLTGEKKLLLTDHLLKQWYPGKIDADRRAAIIRKAPDKTIYVAQYGNLFRLNGDQPELILSIASSDKITSVFPVSRSLVYIDAVFSQLIKWENGSITIPGYDNFYKPGSGDQFPGEWYIGNGGAFYFHRETGTVSVFIDLMLGDILWPSAMLKENDFLWVATHDGLVKMKPAIFASYNLKDISRFPDYYSAIQLKDGRFLAGGNRGMITEKKDTGFTLFKKYIVPKAEIKGFYEDERGWLWIATGYQGLVLTRNGKTERFTNENGLHDNSFISFLKTKKGELYAIGEHGLTQIMVDEKGLISFKKFHSLPNRSRYAKFFSAVDAPDGTVWIGGEEGIIYLRNDSLTRFTFNGKQMAVNFLLKDKEGKIWIATAGEGILQCSFNRNNELEIEKEINESDGLNTLNYLTMLEDSEGDLWAGSSRGLSFIGRQGKYKNRILNFDESDGFIKPGYSSISLYQDKEKRIWAVTTAGITSLDPAAIHNTDLSPLVYITSVKRSKRNKLISNKIISRDTAETRFKFSDNSFSFTFTALDYADQENTRFFYKMDGLDTNWTSCGTLRTINFENLSPGNYSFRVKALSSKGTWSKDDAVYSFTIIPPFWKTWWFISLFLITVTALTFFLIKRRIGFIKKREAEKTELQKIKAASYQSRLETEQVINYFATSISVQTTIDEMLWDVAKNLIGKLGFEDCMIYLWNKDKTVLLQKAGFGLKGSMQSVMDKTVYHVPKGKGIVGEAVESGHYILSNDTSLDKRYFSVDEKVRLSELCVPIIHNNEAMGAINTEHSAKNFYTDRHLQILTTIASMLADKIDTIEAQQQTREKEMEVLKLSKDLATSQLNTLRAQMNPHFLFNAMNSIQQFTLKNDVDNANRYLSRFSTLLRNVLHSSRQKFITLEEEIEQLDLYLDIEKLRLGDSFQYSIEVANEIETDAVKIPGMLIQPFVENALKHGLSPKEGIKKLDIFFSLEEADILQVKITDNGIGRLKAKELKEQQEKLLPYESKGIPLVEERLKLLSSPAAQKIIQFEDMYDSNGHSTGTQVILSIPLQSTPS